MIAPAVYDLSAPNQQQALSQVYEGLDRIPGQSRSEYEEHPWERGALSTVPVHHVAIAARQAKH